ncbi:MAG: DMT family transporter [Bacteroidales bacterium]|nr:DMT family transporter [Bacteroidales bacterium]MDD3272934.1 DMT family transporter [Bacteroidales bacterium]MDD4057436.1 DMT family transporter [Bacteroidales bacterium]
MSNQKKAVVLASFVVFFWATVATAFKLALEGMGAVTLLLISSVTALAVFTIYLIINKRLASVLSSLKEPKVLLSSAWQGALNPFIYYLILFKGYSMLPAQIAQPLNFSWQVVLILLMAIFLKQKIGFKQAFGVLISFTGIVILSLNNGADTSGSLSGTGVFFILLSTVIWAVYWMLKIDNSKDPVEELFRNFLVGSLYLLIAFIIYPEPVRAGIPLYAALYIGVFEMGITFILWNKALNIASNRVTVTQMIYLAPMLSFVIINRVLGEHIVLLTILGLILIVSGIFISNMKGKKAVER